MALGFDITSSQERWDTAGKARDEGEFVASPPFILVQDEGRHGATPVVAAYAPVYREGDPGSKQARLESIKGFAVAIFRVGAARRQGRVGRGRIGPRPLAAGHRQPEARPWPTGRRTSRRLPRRAGFEIRFPVKFATREWSLDVFALPDAFLPSKRGALEVALFGTLASIIGLVTLTSLRTISRLRRQAEKVGPYRLIARLGKGAMGVVWEARHALLRRPTAVKLLAPGTEGERALARFEREVQLTAGLTHPSTIAIYDYGRTADGVFYYAMELLRGINLGQLVEFDGPIAPGRVVHLLRQACGALAEAHAAGLIHRDIKPANLMLCVYGGIPDFVKVLDFGLVKEIGDVEQREGRGRPEASDAALSQDGSLLGTPLYMAPEGMSDPSQRGRARGHLRARRRRLLSSDRQLALSGAHRHRGLQDGAAGAAAAAVDRRPAAGARRARARSSTAASPSSATSARPRPRSSTPCSRPAPSSRPGPPRMPGPGGTTGARRRSPWPPPSARSARNGASS